MLEFASNFIGLQNCTICGKINNSYVCELCKKRLKKYESFRFFVKNKSYYNKAFYCYKYKGLIRKLLINYKFNGKAYLCNYFAKMLLNCKKTYGFFSFYDIIIPVPMDENKRLIRGYNQTVLITNVLAKNLNIINGNNIIIKTRNTKTQSTLNELQRLENVKNAFEINAKFDVTNKRIIVFDDIYTTGATVNEISRILKENGAKEILVLVLAKD